MKRRSTRRRLPGILWVRWLLWTALAGLLTAPAGAWAQQRGVPGEAERKAPATAEGKPGSELPAGDEPLTLELLERIAFARNPTLRQADAAVEVARGRRKQAGLYPNPVIHYHGEEIFQEGRAGQHGPRFEQTIVIGGKLRTARQVRDREVEQAQALRRGQEVSVLVNVRELYYHALAAQERIETRTRLLTVATETLETSRELHNIGLVKESELLRAQVEADRARLALNRANVERARVWRQLGAVLNDPRLSAPRPLAGSLEVLPPKLDPAVELQRLVEQSPEVDLARAGVARAEALVRRQRAERTPNLNVLLGPSYDFNTRRTLLEVDVAVPLPLFNRNQGNIQAAKAEVQRAQAEVERVQLSLRNRFSPAFEQYETNLRLVEEYRQRVLPTAARAYELSLEAYRRNAESFDEVLVAQRTFFQAQVEFVDALEEVQQALVQIRGFLLEARLSPVMPPEPAELPEIPVNPFP